MHDYATVTEGISVRAVVDCGVCYLSPRKIQILSSHTSFTLWVSFVKCVARLTLGILIEHARSAQECRLVADDAGVALESPVLGERSLFSVGSAEILRSEHGVFEFDLDR